MHSKIFAYNKLNEVHFVILFSGNLSVWFKSFTDLELGVSEFWQLFPTHILSLEFVLGFCLGIAKGGDCKVGFI